MTGVPALIPELDVADVEASLRFYVQVLGFVVVRTRPEEAFAHLALDDVDLMVKRASGPGRRSWLTPRAS